MGLRKSFLSHVSPKGHLSGEVIKRQLSVNVGKHIDGRDRHSGTFMSQTPTCSFSARDVSREGVKVPADTRARFAIKRERDDRGEIQSEVVINVPEQLFIP
ncbi:uncharacterized [Tachysurus ichikawai]